jgi:hypothetical protein
MVCNQSPIGHLIGEMKLDNLSGAGDAIHEPEQNLSGVLVIALGAIQ